VKRLFLKEGKEKVWLTSQVYFQILPEQKSIFRFNRLVYFLFWRWVLAIGCHRRGKWLGPMVVLRRFNAFRKTRPQSLCGVFLSVERPRAIDWAAPSKGSVLLSVADSFRRVPKGAIACANSWRSMRAREASI